MFDVLWSLMGKRADESAVLAFHKLNPPPAAMKLDVCTTSRHGSAPP
ncbi:hypothetical protein [Corallococcus caeni]